ncbi:MAG: HAD family phosphatase [Treponema sp.]
MKAIKAVIFDMDGVLLDTETICDRTWKIAGSELGLEDVNDIINACRGCNKNDTRIILKKKYGKEFDAKSFMDRTSILFHEIEIREGIPVMKGAVHAIEYLAQAGYRLALASSTHGITVRRQMENTGLLKWFETITTGDMVEHSKPDPEIYTLACSSLCLTPEQCAAIEDSPNGIHSAYNAGLKCIMIPDKIAPTDEIKHMLWKLCTSLDQIPLIFP